MYLFISRKERKLLESLNKIYNVGLYIRLSKEDDDKTYESESITNQKSLLLQYVKENNLRVQEVMNRTNSFNKKGNLSIGARFKNLAI